MLESAVEAYFVRKVEAAGAEQRKFTSPGRRHVTDRLCGWPPALMDFVELKAPGEKPRPGQVREHQRWRRLGFSVWVLDTKAKVDAYVAHRTRAAPPPEFQGRRVCPGCSVILGGLTGDAHARDCKYVEKYA